MIREHKPEFLSVESIVAEPDHEYVSSLSLHHIPHPQFFLNICCVELILHNERSEGFAPPLRRPVAIPPHYP